MANEMVNAHETEILAHLTGGAAYSQPTYYVGALTAITDAEAGTVTEVTGGTYARVAPTFTGTNPRSNDANIDLNIPSGNTVVGIAIWDASSAGNIKWVKAVTNEAFAAAGVYRIATGALYATSQSIQQ